MAEQPDHAHDLTDDTEEQARQQFTSQFRQPPPRKKNTVEAGEKRSRPGRPPGSKNKPKSVDTLAASQKPAAREPTTATLAVQQARRQRQAV